MADELDGAIARAATRAWQRVLDVDDIDPDDDFFELGGHSLSAMRVVSMVCHDIETDFGVAVLLDNSEFADFVRGVAEHIGGATENGSLRAALESR